VAEAIRHEALVNLALAETAATVLCPYAAELGAEVLTAAGRTHPAVVQAGAWQPSPAYQPGHVYPDGYDLPLPAPPDSAVSMTYREEQEQVRAFAADQASHAGLAPGRIVDVIIATGELAGNTMAHTTGPGTVTTWVADGEFIVQVSDRGRLQNPLAGRIRPEPESLGRGRGLWVVHQVSDLFEIRSTAAGNTLRVHFRL
jgi:anti-sigma regulatory factor (Ser/Thr protein kinase)